ncbi:Hypothetical predicted protein [Mytilus galloprovincialis]|uniref:Uncharacterized protein n=1 Tax=Mytilus galloprovincialis TaxID=29158 RepID=A0A8B6G6Q7_MYTGA|nr:Hypothetical predicted protein [Mytilus galloprovincialis]
MAEYRINDRKDAPTVIITVDNNSRVYAAQVKALKYLTLTAFCNEEDQLDFLLGEEFGEDDDAELYSPPNVDTLSSQDTCSSQSSQSISDPLERHIYWKDDNTEDNGNVDLRTTPFKPTRQPGFQTTNFTRYNYSLMNE